MGVANEWDPDRDELISLNSAQQIVDSRNFVRPADPLLQFCLLALCSGLLELHHPAILYRIMDIFPWSVSTDPLCNQALDLAIKAKLALNPDATMTNRDPCQGEEKYLRPTADGQVRESLSFSRKCGSGYASGRTTREPPTKSPDFHPTDIRNVMSRWSMAWLGESPDSPRSSSGDTNRHITCHTDDPRPWTRPVALFVHGI